MTIQVRDAKALFFEAVEQHSPDQWQAFLQARCGGQADLKRYVEELLKAHAKADSLLDAADAKGDGRGVGGNEADSLNDTPYCQVGTVTLEADEIGTEIGPYKLLEQIGEGGMGIVYLAEQREPVRRRVALKIIKPGMDSRQVVARFEAERQALALMDHPNIAKVLDAGQVGPVCRTGHLAPPDKEESPARQAGPTGRPYFVMELVRGVPITEYCDQARLTIGKRLELFVTVCKAVQHAHQKGIIHRDLKPSNVMVTLHDGLPVVKVIDFGVAKAINQQLTDHTLHTGFLQVIGTPLYMSPEQAELSGLDIDTRSDIYSLGVLLYELLTGHTPFDREILKEKGLDEFRRIVREVEPPRPSGRVSTLDDQARSTAASRRSSEPRRLSVTLRGELDWLVLKALEKDRNRRYETASAFAADVERFLNNEPVEACPPSRVYRLRKFARRNKGLLTATTLVLAALVGGTGISLWQAYRASNAAKGQAEEAHRATESARRADENYQRVKDSVNKYYRAVVDDPRLKQHGYGELRLQLMQTAMPFYQELSQQQPHDNLSRAEVIKALQRLAEIQHESGHHKQAAANYEQVADVFEQLVKDHPDNPAAQVELAGVHNDFGIMLNDIGEHEQAEPHYLRAIELWNQLLAQDPMNSVYRRSLTGPLGNLATLHKHLGRFPEAEAEYAKAIETQEALAARADCTSEDRAGLASSLNAVAMLSMQLGRGEAAEKDFARAIETQQRLVSEFPDVLDYQDMLATILDNQGVLWITHGMHADAATAFRKAVEIVEPLVRRFDGEAAYRHRLAQSCNNLAMALSNLGQSAEAEPFARRAAELHERLAKEFPEVPQYRLELVGSLSNVATLLGELDKPGEGEAFHRRAIAMQKLLVEQSPEVPEYRARLSGCYQNFGRLLLELNKLVEAEDAHRAAIDQRLRLPADYQALPDCRGSLANSHNSLALVLVAQGKLTEGENAYRRAVEIFVKLLMEIPDRPAYRLRLIGTLSNLGTLLEELGENGQALAAYRQAIEIGEPPGGQLPDNEIYGRELAKCYEKLAFLTNKLGEVAEAAAAWRRAIELIEPLAEESPADLDHRVNLATWHNNLAAVLDEIGQADAAEQALRLAIEYQSGLAADLPEDQETALYLVIMRGNLSGMLIRGNKLDESDAEIRQALELCRTLAQEFPDTPDFRHQAVACLYNLACLYARRASQTKSDDLRELHAAQAVDYLNQMAASGFRDVEHITSDKDLDPIRARDDFRKIIAQMQARSQPPDQPATEQLAAQPRAVEPLDAPD